MTKAKTGTIGSSLRARMASGGEAQEATTTSGASSDSGRLESVNQPSDRKSIENPVPFNTRLAPTLQKRVKMHSVGEGRRIQDIVHDALEEYLNRRKV